KAWIGILIIGNRLIGHNAPQHEPGFDPFPPLPPRFMVIVEMHGIRFVDVQTRSQAQIIHQVKGLFLLTQAKHKMENTRYQRVSPGLSGSSACNSACTIACGVNVARRCRASAAALTFASAVCSKMARIWAAAWSTEGCAQRS